MVKALETAVEQQEHGTCGSRESGILFGHIFAAGAAFPGAIDDALRIFLRNASAMKQFQQTGRKFWNT